MYKEQKYFFKMNKDVGMLLTAVRVHARFLYETFSQGRKLDFVYVFLNNDYV